LTKYWGFGAFCLAAARPLLFPGPFQRFTHAATAALIRKAGSSGYFREDAGRCLMYLLAPPKSATVFVETAQGSVPG